MSKMTQSPGWSFKLESSTTRIKERQSGLKPVAHFCWTRLICGTKAKLAEAPGGRHHLPDQPGRQRHSPVVAWQPSAWKQSHLFRQPGPNVPICTCEQMPTGKRIVRGISWTFGQLSQNQTKYYTGSVLVVWTAWWVGTATTRGERAQNTD